MICYKIAVGKNLIWQNALTEKLLMHASGVRMKCAHAIVCNPVCAEMYEFSHCMHLVAFMIELAQLGLDLIVS